VQWAIASGRYSSVTEYVRELIREDEKRKAEERPEALPVEGVEGNDAALTRTDWKDIRKEALAQVKTRQKNRR
jgi:antitoxin ParD1/3/4